MNPLPFELELFLPQDSYSGPFRVMLVPTPEEPGETLEELDYAGSLDLLNLFVRAANMQLFHDNPANPLVKMDVELLAWQEAEKNCILVGRVNDLPAYAWLILAAMLNKTHLALETLAHMRVVGEHIMTPLSIETLKTLVGCETRRKKSLPEIHTSGQCIEHRLGYIRFSLDRVSGIEGGRGSTGQLQSIQGYDLPSQTRYGESRPYNWATLENL